MQKEQMSKKKTILMEGGNAGITLIALIITVIVLLILAGTAISIAINGGDIFGKAREAREGWNSAVAEEQEKINEVWSILNTISDGNGGGDPVGLTVPTELAPGDTVTFSTIPSGTYEWNKEYYSDDDTVTKTLYAGAAANTNGATASTNWDDTTTKIDMTITSWKVLDVSSDRKTVRLVPSAPTTAGVKLRGAQGYNNAVKLLNDVCDALYGGAAGSADGITARSISMVDLEGTTATDPNRLMIGTYSKGDSYETRKGPYTVAYSKYPLIYGEEALRKIDGTESNTGIGMSEEATIGLDTNGFIPRVNGARNTVEDKAIEPAHTYYNLSNSDFTTALGTNASLINGSSTRDYWVASRCVYAGGSDCSFRVRRVSGGYLSTCDMFYSNGKTRGDTLGLFPLVSLSSGVLSRSRPCIHIYTSFVGRSKKSRVKMGASPAGHGRTGLSRKNDKNRGVGMGEIIARIKLLGFFVNVSYDKKIINQKKYLKVGERLDEVAKYTIGWLKTTISDNKNK